MRRMSFTLTTRQIVKGQKDVTRRLGWANLRPGEEFLAIEKGMGLKKGEHQVVLRKLWCISNRPEPLNVITPADCVREGFPELTPGEFVKMFCKHMGGKRDQIVNRIEFGYLDF